jgi:hypothetical protein
LVDVDQLNARYGFSYSIPYYTGYPKANFILCFVWRPNRKEPNKLVTGVSEGLKKCIPAPSKLTVKSSEVPEGDNSKLEQYNSERIALLEVKRVLKLVAAGKLKVGEKTRLPSASCIQQVQEILCEPETPLGAKRSKAWPVLIQQCGWAKSRAGKLILTATGKTLLEDFAVERYADGIGSMVYDLQFDEMFRASRIKGMKGRRASRYRESADFRRENIFYALKDFPVGKWVHIKDAFDHVVASGNSFYVVTEGYCLYIGEANYGHLSGQEQGIARVYFRVLTVDSFVTLGLLDSAAAPFTGWGSPDLSDCWGLDDVDSLTDCDSVEYLRLTPLGAFCFGATFDYKMPTPEKRTLFHVLPNHEIVVTHAEAFSTGDAAQLDRFAKKISESVWKMDKKTIFRALEVGDSAEDILSVLQVGTANEIPPTLQLLIEETVARSGAAIQREEAVAITFLDEHTAVLVEHESAIRPTIFCRKGNTLFVRAKNLKKFQSGLRKLGILLP